MIPARQAAITIAGPETRNIGACITGKRSPATISLKVFMPRFSRTLPPPRVYVLSCAP
jgi:hypothetical protein